jgi:hypothetical protein
MIIRITHKKTWVVRVIVKRQHSSSGEYELSTAAKSFLFADLLLSRFLLGLGAFCNISEDISILSVLKRRRLAFIYLGALIPQ